MALIVPSERPCDAVAKETTSLIGLPRTLLHRLLSEYPETARRLRIQLLARLKDFTKDLQSVGKVFDDLG
jgi:CRP-like cAMP-binding protein